jgi:uncharacterized protein YegL
MPATSPRLLRRVPLLTLLFLAFSLLQFVPAGPAAAVLAQDDPLECETTHDKTAAPDVVTLGEEVQVTLQVGGTCPSQERKVDVVLVIDRSSSMSRDNKFADAKSAATAFVDNINPALVQVGIVAFDDVVEDVIGLSSDIAALRQAIQSIQLNSGTNLVDSLDAGRQMLQTPAARADAAPVIIFMTDGKHSVNTPDISRISPVIAQVRLAGISVYSIGLGNDVDEALLRTIAGDPDHYFFSPDGQALQDIYVQIAGRIDAAVLFRSMTVVDQIPANMDLVNGTVNPTAAWDAAARTLTWTLQDVPETGRSLTYRLMPLEGGSHPTNVVATATYVDGLGSAGNLTFPVPMISVLIPGGPGCICDAVRNRVPRAVINFAMANPEKIQGWKWLLDPNKPPSPANPRRECLDLRSSDLDYHWLFNAPIWRVGCR